VKRGAIVVNAARGGLVDESALRQALESGHIAAAAFDVFTTEPAKESVLFGAPNFVATPHLGASTNEAQENVAIQVAEQIADYLLTGAVINALNMATVTAEEASRLKPFMVLIEKLGSFAGQIADEGIEAVEIEYEGDVAQLNTQPLTSIGLAALMRPLMPDVNMVSASSVFKHKGASLTESKRETSPVYGSLIRIKVKTGGRWRTLAGAVNAGTAKIVEVKDMPLEADFHPVMLLINNRDKPGFIGALGTMLGDANINIATFHLGRQAAEEDAIALVGVDQVVPDLIQAKLRELPHVRYVKVLRF
jgi:D-3-phosphoglycerate dehydrogenase / 2-oxoglutarate reductase